MAKRKSGFIMRLIDLTVLVLTLAAVLGMIFAFAAPTVNPNKAWIFAYAGLAAPILYLTNLFLMLYWIIRWKAVFILPALVMLVGLPKIKTFYHFPQGKPSEETSVSPGSIRIMTYNVEGFLNYGNGTPTPSSSAWNIVSFIKRIDPDIICIQEFQSTPNVPESVISGWLSDWPHRSNLYTISQNGRDIFGSAIYSKFPIVSDESIRFDDSRNGALRADLRLPSGDTIRVFCNHMETTYVQDDDLRFLQPENFAGNPDKTGQLRQIAGRLRRGFRKRAEQADTLASRIAESEFPTLVCGDFNDPPISYTYQTIRGRFGDAFEDRGEGYGYTYKRLYRLMRIDYILYSPHFETVSYESPDIEWSDHKPVTAVFRLTKE